MGVDKIELWAAAPQIDLLALTPAFCRTLHQKLKERGLSVYAVTPEQCNYPVNLAAEEDPMRAAAFLALGFQGLFSMECNDPRYRSDPRGMDRRNASWLKQHGWL